MKNKSVIKFNHGSGVNVLCFALAGKIFVDSLIKLDKWVKEDELTKATERSLAAFEKLQEQIDKFELKKSELENE